MDADSARQIRKAKRNISVIKVIAVVWVLFVILTQFCWFTSPTIQAARRAQAHNDVAQIASAISAFQTEYGALPNWTNGAVSGELLATLLGSNAVFNPRQIIFLEPYPAKKGKSGIADGAFVDPWGVPYRFAVDIDGDGKVRAGPNNVEVQKPVAVWSDTASSETKTNPDQLRRRYVTSWE